MSAVVPRLPMVGWCVRPGAGRAHFLFMTGGRQVSACACVERLELYAPQRLRPLQGAKPKCLACEQYLRRKAVA
jgi:hypothetical protein